MQTGQQVSQNPAAPTNGQSALHELFALTDEQILEIEPEVQDVEVSSGQTTEPREESSRVAPASLPGNSVSPRQNEGRSEPNQGANQGADPGAQPGLAAAQEPPAWLVAQMKDPWTGGEAKELWNGIVQARKEAADYRAAFASPEDARALKELYPGGVSEARAVAQRARTLDDIDRAYFGAAGGSAEQTSAARAQLAAMMMQEDPAAFREMVFAGLRALEEAGQGTSNKTLAQAFRPEGGSSIETPAMADRKGLTPERVSYGDRPTSPTVGAPRTAPLSRNSSPSDDHVAAYAAFEKAANEDLERSVGASIERTLVQALPNLGRDARASGIAAQQAAPLQTRLSAAIRLDVEAALKGDRQLGEQVAQILSSRRLDNETRAQVVRLIGERAQQLVPVAAKRVLNDWTQTTLAAHRGNTARTEAASTRREVAPASPDSGRPFVEANSPRASQTRRSDDSQVGASRPDSRRVDYRKLSDEQILDL
jgi:hypothetical protein